MKPAGTRAVKIDATENYSNGNRWDFQIEAAKKIVSDVENSEYLGAVLNGAVGSGKTAVLIHALNSITSSNPDSSILFLAHAQNSLKQQTLDAFADSDAPIKPKFTFGLLGEGKQVTVAIPQEFYRFSGSDGFSYAIIDEAHQWFTSQSVFENIISRFNIKKMILASGTISIFNRFNQETKGKKFAITQVAGEEIQKRGLYSALDIDLVRVSDTRDTYQSLKSAFEKAKRNSDSTDRPVIICGNCTQAEQAKLFLEAYGYSVALATSRHDPKNVEIDRFKSGNKAALVLVGRGLVGLNIPEADFMVDLKRSKNIEVVIQYLARMLRQHPDGKKKCFMRVTSTQDWNSDLITLHKVISLNRADVMSGFTGNNLKLVAI